MISLDYSILLQMLLFVILWVVLTKVLFQPYVSLLEERERKTEGAEEESFALEEEGERLRVLYEEDIAKARAAGVAAKEAILQEGRQQREHLLNRVRAEALEGLERARLDIRNQLSREREIAIREADIIAQDMAEKVLGRRVR
jgi:F-type H+-transporting ATPase subunit b